MTTRRAGILTALTVAVLAAGAAGCDQSVSPTEPDRMIALPDEPTDTTGFIPPFVPEM
ncbi:MAG TPA: hypothetical protein VFX98_10510 [Longimicrobiaceae bacterium]|nr:hypothetical protein [Longimicrobiaceae bacterium]